MQAEIQRIREALGQTSGGSSDFDLNPALGPARVGLLRPAAVLVAIRPGPVGLQLILTKRASHLKHHPGQIAFPGGKVDPEDADDVAAALREAHEEIGLDPASVEILGRLPSHETVTGFAVVPVLGFVRDDFTPVAEIDEVEEVFCVPFAHVLNPGNFTVEKRMWRGEWRRYYTVPYGPYYIWGATARILRGLAERLGG